MQKLICFETDEYSNANGHQHLCAQPGISKNIFLTIIGERLPPLLHPLYLILQIWWYPYGIAH